MASLHNGAYHAAAQRALALTDEYLERHAPGLRDLMAAECPEGYMPKRRKSAQRRTFKKKRR